MALNTANHFQQLANSTEFKAADEKIFLTTKVEKAVNGMFGELSQKFSKEADAKENLEIKGDGNVGQIIAQVLAAIQPILVSTVVNAVNSAQSAADKRLNP